MPVRFFYWANEYSDKLRPLLDSARANDIWLEPIGENRPVRDFHHSLFKQQALFDAVKDLDRDQVVCATDGFDAFFQRGPAFVLDTFRSFGSDVVFSAERGYSHQHGRFKAFFDATASASPYRYLNAGAVIGYAWAIEKLYCPSLGLRAKVAITRIRGMTKALAWLATFVRKLGFLRADPGRDLSWYGYTDQAIMGKHAAQGKTGISIELDRNCRLFWCTAFEWEDIDEHCKITGGKFQNFHTGQIPAIVHVPWPQKRSVFERMYGSIYGPHASPDERGARSDLADEL